MRARLRACRLLDHILITIGTNNLMHSTGSPLARARGVLTSTIAIAERGMDHSHDATHAGAASSGKQKDDLMAITASFNNGTLSIAGDDTQNLIMVSRDVAGTILVNGGALAITGGPATIGNTSLIEVSALGDIDTIQFDDANGALPAATINGGDGADSIVGRGEPDVIIGGRGNDLALMGAGDDRFIWNPGDGSDVVEGQSGSDTLQFNGANIAEKIDISANGGRVRFT